MVIAWTSISGVSDVGNNISLPYITSLCKAIGITLEMGIIEDQLFISAQLVNSCSAALALEQFSNYSVSSGQDWGSRSSRNIDRIMHSPFRPRIGESIDQLIWSHASDGNNEFQYSNKARGRSRTSRL